MLEEKRIDTSLVDKAIQFAVKSHAGALRKGTVIPYILHPLEAASIAATITDDQDIIAAAVLHDVVEDADVSLDEIEGKFNDKIRDLVAYESEDKKDDLPKEDTWLIRKQEAIRTLKTAPIEAKIVALSDKLSNIRAIKRDFATKGVDMWAPFNQKSHNMQGAYYKALIRTLIELKDYDAWKEYRLLVRDVFGEYPTPDRSDYELHKEKDENGEYDLFRSTQITSDWRPYITEMWYADHTYYITIFFSSMDIEKYSMEDLANMLEAEGIVQFATDEKSISPESWTDPAGNELWSITIKMKDEDTTYARH